MTSYNSQLSAARRTALPTFFKWVVLFLFVVVVVAWTLFVNACTFLGSNKATANAATPIHITNPTGKQWVGDTYAHDNWVQLCKSHGADARPAYPDAKVGWVLQSNGTYFISQEAYDQYFDMDQAAAVNPGLYMSSTSKP